MSVAVRRLLICVIFLCGLPSTTFAAPPASCANKFVGPWSVKVVDTGRIYIRQIKADGNTTMGRCPFCVPQTWSCNGNTYMLLGPDAATHTLSSDGKRMTGLCCVATRIGGAAVAANPDSKVSATKPEAEKQDAKKQDAKKQNAKKQDAGKQDVARQPPRVAGLQSSVAGQPPQGDQSSRSSARPPWSGSREDCDLAGETERQTAGWYNMCVEPVVDPARRARYRGEHYQPSVDPQKLHVRGRDICRTAPVEAMQRCLMDIKVNILMSEDVAIGAECASKDAGNLIACVHGAYLYGPGGTLAAFEERIRWLAGNTSNRGTAGQSTLRDGRCQPGYGMKPGASGGWSRQSLGVIDRARAGAANAAATDAGAASDPVQAFERRVNNIAATAVVVVADAVGEPLPGADRELCKAAAFAAVRSVLKGGAPPVPEKCRPMANAARAELAYYATARIDTLSNPAVEELLSALAERGSQPGGSDASRSARQ